MRSFISTLILGGISSFAYAADVFIDAPDGATISQLEEPLALSILGSDNAALTLSQRRDSLALVNSAGVTQTLVGSNATDSQDLTSFSGTLTHFLYKHLTADQSLSGTVLLGSGTTGGSSNEPLILDLGEYDLTVNGNLEAQGAHFISTVNSLASNDGKVLDGVNALTIDSSTTGQIFAGSLIEQTSGNPGNFKILLDVNSTLQNNASFNFATETNGQSSSVIAYSALDSENSRLLDTSYVMNSAASRSIDGSNNERIVITFSRANDEYITKSQTLGHPSNNAALSLGTIAADGVARGEMQTALTELDINDFGFGNDAENLATNVKRLAPIANNSIAITALDAIGMVAGATDYRMSARRGNWSGYKQKSQSIWLRGMTSTTDSSGSVPPSNASTQDTAGHDGYDAFTSGLTLGGDKTFKNGAVGVALSRITADIRQDDDRQGERSKQQQNAYTLYGQINSKKAFLLGSYTHASGHTKGIRKSALDRIAQFDAPFDSSALAFKAGRRFDLIDGRSAITPFLKLNLTKLQQHSYQETGAGDLSLYFYSREVKRNTTSLGLDFSHKRRVFGVKALTTLSVALGSDETPNNIDINTRYTGNTNTLSASYTSFSTPVERWASRYTQLGAQVQLEMPENTLLRIATDAEFRNGRQRATGQISLIWPF